LYIIKFAVEEFGCFHFAAATPRSSSLLPKYNFTEKERKKRETINMNGKNRKRAFAVRYLIHLLYM
jgi:hypothetical protein